MVKCIKTNLTFLLLLVFVSPSFWSQNPTFDRLEQLYDQGHFGMVWRKAGRYLKHNNLSESILPVYYQSMASIQLGVRRSFKRKEAEDLAQELEELISLLASEKGQTLLRSHQEEVLHLSESLTESLTDEFVLKNANIKNLLQTYQPKIDHLAKGKEREDKPKKNNESLVWKAPDDPALETQVKLITYAFTLENIPYKYGGTTTEGFDCSGFTSYVFSKVLNKKLPRRSVDQFEQATRIEKADVQMGDLVFFGSDGIVSHVGIIINEKGKALRMIHASSSRGITTDWIEDSDYFRPRLMGFGRY
ncbi:MAG: C40 family peptidase [Flavobacteriales bacterium]